jgi:hypothetical protein
MATPMGAPRAHTLSNTTERVAGSCAKTAETTNKTTKMAGASTERGGDNQAATQPENTELTTLMP